MTASRAVADDTFAALWERAVQQRPGAVFLVFEADDGVRQQWTYQSFDQAVAGLASLLAANAVGRSDTVHVSLRNCPEFVALWLALARLGARLVACDPQATTDEIADHLDRTAPRLGVCGQPRAATYLAAPGAARLPVWELAEDGSTISGWQQHAPGPTAPLAAPPRPGDDLAVMFTSGTTSRPKGVVLSQALYAFTGRTMARATGLTADDRWLVVLPLFHANAQYYCLASAVAAGASVALMSRFSASGWTHQAKRHEVTHASLFAAPMRMVLARTPADRPRPRLTAVWYAQNLAAADLDRFAALTGCPPRQLYGMTETGPAVLTDRGELPTPGSMGTVTPSCGIRLADPASDQPADQGKVGALQVRGLPGRTLFTGYLHDPDETARAFTPADDEQVWFATGDLASADQDGRYRFHGRGSDIVKVGGENVSLVEVEAVLLAHPDLLEVAAAAAADPMLDEVVVAYAVPHHPTTPPATADVLAWAAARLSPAKRPRQITFVGALPRTSVGKLRRFALTAAASTDGTVTVGTPSPAAVAPSAARDHATTAPTPADATAAAAVRPPST